MLFALVKLPNNRGSCIASTTPETGTRLPNFYINSRDYDHERHDYAHPTVWSQQPLAPSPPGRGSAHAGGSFPGYRTRAHASSCAAQWCHPKRSSSLRFSTEASGAAGDGTSSAGDSSLSSTGSADANLQRTQKRSVVSVAAVNRQRFKTAFWCATTQYHHQCTTMEGA
jgi:hypothetical protein